MPVLRRIVFLPALLLLCTAHAQEADVTFFVIGKHGNFLQDASGHLEAEDFSFFSEIFLTEDGDASDATLLFPTDEANPFRDMRQAPGGEQDNILLLAGEDRFSSYADLLERYPDGDYRVSFSTPSGLVKDGLLNFKERPLPAPPTVSVQQGGQTNCSVISPVMNAVVRWGEFTQGRADPNDILDDLIFVILTDADGNRVAHSGRPFEGKPFLTYASDNFVIDSDVLEPNQVYTLSVEHALLDDTTRFGEVPAFNTRAVTTKVELRTWGWEMESCAPVPAPPPISSQITMFYYKDISDADHFYGEILELENTLDWGWIKFYKTGPASTVGLVTEGDGGWHKVQASNAVMLSLVTTEIDAWYARIKDKPGVRVLKEVGDGGPIRSFLLEDPGGYTIEFFQWLETPE